MTRVPIWMWSATDTPRRSFHGAARPMPGLVNVHIRARSPSTSSPIEPAKGRDPRRLRRRGPRRIAAACVTPPVGGGAGDARRPMDHRESLRSPDAASSGSGPSVSRSISRVRASPAGWRIAGAGSLRVRAEQSPEQTLVHALPRGLEVRERLLVGGCRRRGRSAPARTAPAPLKPADGAESRHGRLVANTTFANAEDARPLACVAPERSI